MLEKHQMMLATQESGLHPAFEVTCVVTIFLLQT